ncbi:MAG TPA: hypothetical protein VI583_08700 [Cyclobacteriaceae bacterium]|nr:hypothetical protein [Cyclobacteriaceae bacterium]
MKRLEFALLVFCFPATIFLTGCGGKSSLSSDDLESQNAPLADGFDPSTAETDSIQPGSRSDSAKVDMADTAQYHLKFINSPTPVRLEPGLWYMEIMPDTPSTLTATHPLIVVKIVPGYFRFELLLARQEAGMTSESTGLPEYKTSAEWAEMKGYSAAINAGSYDTTSLPQGYLLYNRDTLRSEILPSHRQFLGISHSGYAHIYDDQCGTLPDSLEYGISLVRIQDCLKKVVWGVQPGKQWSLACIAEDDEGCIYFVHSRSAYMVTDIARSLRKHFDKLQTIAYLEAGPASSLAVNSREVRQEFFGSYMTVYWEKDDRATAQPLPNVIGIKRR